MHWYPAYVGLGSNLDEPAQRVTEALGALQQLPETRDVAGSSLYGSHPMGPVSQADFCNAVAGMLTRLPPLEFLRALRSLERQLGRQPPRERWGPRRIDLDLLVHGSEQLTSAELTVPHPGIVQRNFVLYPLADVAPDLQIPGLGRVTDLLRGVSSDGLWRLDGQAFSAAVPA
jgi:2-amino-4-hydroxy-6-hydroxymethyldihydropteridine diphosphokinase